MVRYGTAGLGRRADLVLALITEWLSAACRAALPEPSSKLTVHS
jgi:hypothetical protein